jgi:hypothetical protein
LPWAVWEKSAAKNRFRYRGCVQAKIAQVPPLTPGRWLIAVSIPLMAGWIAATVKTKTDVFGGPFPVFLYILVVGAALFVWGVLATPISPQKRTLHRFCVLVLEELALGVAFFFLFSAIVGP